MGITASFRGCAIHRSSSHAALLLASLLVCGMAAQAQEIPKVDIPWEKLGNPRLTDDQKARLKIILNDTWNFGGCGGPIAYCLKEEPDDRWTLRTAKAVIRLFQGGMTDGKIAIEMMLREQSANPRKKLDFDLTDHAPLGTTGAPVTLVIWSDFQCPACKLTVDQVHRLVEKYAGKICVYYKHFPIPKHHPQAIPAAMATIAAHRHGKFWPMHDLVYKNAPDNLSGDSLVGFAVSLGIAERDFRKAFAAPETYQYLERDIKEGNKSGIDRTPLLFFNGKRFVAKRDFATLAERVEEELDLLREAQKD